MVVKPQPSCFILHVSAAKWKLRRLCRANAWAGSLYYASYAITVKPSQNHNMTSNKIMPADITQDTRARSDGASVQVSNNGMFEPPFSCLDKVANALAWSDLQWW